MKKTDLAHDLEQRLLAAARELPLPGIRREAQRTCLARQMVDSVRRIQYVHHVRDTQISPNRADPTSAIFDPVRASVLKLRQGDLNEAYWLVFLSTHFGKHASKGWQLCGKVYGRIGEPGLWDWQNVSSDVNGFRDWLRRSRPLLPGDRFSNHRKYESLDPDSPSGTGSVVASYVALITSFGNHRDMIVSAHKSVGQRPEAVFDYLYHAMAGVRRFGRLGRFDFLTMLGKLGIAPILPGSAYLWHNATGPKKGAALLFSDDASAAAEISELDRKLIELDSHLGVGMQVLEDSLCNWQKSPSAYIYFRG